MGNAPAAIGTEQNNTPVALKPFGQIGNRLWRDHIRSLPGLYAIRSPFAEHQLHHWFAPAGERYGRGQLVGIATAANERGVAYAAWSLVQRASG